MGIHGGHPGAKAELFMMREGSDEWLTTTQAFNTVSPSKFSNVPIAPGDSSRGGGGWGPPEKTGPIVIDRGERIYVYDDQGKQYIEAMAGLWSVGVGFGEQRLVDVATRQLAKLPYYHSFSGKSSEPSSELAERLVKMSPNGLDRVFFTHSGSEANDTVIKLVWFYNNAIGRPEKKKFIARMGGYHGITIASGSLTGLPTNHRGFDLPLAFVKHVTTPHHYRFAQPATPASRAASGLWSWSVRRRRLQSQFAMFRAGDAGQSSTNGYGSLALPIVERLIETPCQ